MDVLTLQFLAKTALPLAQAAYDGAPALPAGFKVASPLTLDQSIDRGFLRWILPGEKGDRFGWHIESDTLDVLSFRGTETPTEWDDDLNFDAVAFAFGLVAAEVDGGFCGVYMALRDCVEKALTPGKKLIIVGHSLGAAVATLCAADRKIVPADTELFTFASPRVGKNPFAECFSARHIRVVNRWDLVPKLPPSLLGYVHVGEELEVDSGFCLDEKVNHSLTSYLKGLKEIAPDG